MTKFFSKAKIIVCISWAIRVGSFLGLSLCKSCRFIISDFQVFEELPYSSFVTEGISLLILGCFFLISTWVSGSTWSIWTLQQWSNGSLNKGKFLRVRQNYCVLILLELLYCWIRLFWSFVALYYRTFDLWKRRNGLECLKSFCCPKVLCFLQPIYFILFICTFWGNNFQILL